MPSSPISPRLSIQVVELVERLRAQHVFPLSMLQLHEDEWHQMVGDVAEQAESEQPFSMDADQ